MNVSRRFHALSSSHREPGGLRRLGFFLDRLKLLSGDREPSQMSTLIVDDASGHVALPCASQGYRVSLLDSTTERVEEVHRVAKELNLSVEAITIAKNDLSREFKVIIVPKFDGSPSELSRLLKHRQIALSSGGALLIGLIRPVQISWSAFRASLRSAGWRLRAATAASLTPKRLTKRAHGQTRRGSLIFRAGDWLDHTLSSHWPLGFARAYLLELERCHPRDPYVIHLMPSLGMGGAERVVLDLVSRLPLRHFDAKAVAMIEGGPLLPVFRRLGASVEVVKRRDAWGLSTILDLRRLFSIQRPDIVHTHLFGADAWGRLAAWLAGVPHIVSTEHNINPSYGFVKRFVNRAFAVGTDRVIAVSDEVKRDMLRQHLPSKKITVIRNGIDLDRVSARGARPFHDVPRIICVARLYAQKDHVTLFKALASIARPWRLRLVGIGPLERELRKLADRLHIASRIEWLGAREDVPSLLAGSDIFCLPSRWEGLGIAAIEAAAAGVPVLLSDLPAFHEVMQDDDAVFLSPGDVAAWSEALSEALHDPSAAISRATRARPGVAARVSIENMVDGYARVYRSLMKGGGR